MLMTQLMLTVSSAGGTVDPHSVAITLYSVANSIVDHYSTGPDVMHKCICVHNSVYVKRADLGSKDTIGTADHLDIALTFLTI